MRSATAAGSSGEVTSVTTMVNSSPPSRARVSPPRTVRASRVPARADRADQLAVAGDRDGEDLLQVGFGEQVGNKRVGDAVAVQMLGFERRQELPDVGQVGQLEDGADGCLRYVAASASHDE